MILFTSSTPDLQGRLCIRHASVYLRSALNMEALIKTTTHSAPKLAISAAITLLAFGLWKVMVVLCRRRISTMGLIPGPPSTHWFYRNGKEILAAVSSELHLENISIEPASLKENTELLEAWEAQYGQTFVYHFVLNVGTLSHSLTGGLLMCLNITGTSSLHIGSECYQSRPQT